MTLTREPDVGQAWVGSEIGIPSRGFPVTSLTCPVLVNSDGPG